MVRSTLAAILLCACAPGAEVSVSVFGLFHPRELEIAPALARLETVRITGPFEMSAAQDFVLRVPGRIERRFRGRLAVYRQGGELIPVVYMDIETAVASIVAAESPPGAPVESLKAQAVVARSFLLAARRRHAHSDFCDTTHCQFLREPPAADSPYARAAAATTGLALRYHGEFVEALYSADCGGRTRTPAAARLAPGPYPFFPVDCPARGAPVSGHRIGLCQRGSANLARHAASWRDILRHYFPAATVSP